MTGIEITLFILALLVMLVGVAGTVLPVIPGTVLIFIPALLFGWLTDWSYISGEAVAWLAGLMLIAWALDYLGAAFGAKRFGGGWAGAIGAVVGMIAGIIFPVFGIVTFIVGSFAGAVVGEATLGRNRTNALRAGLGSFIGVFVAGVGKVTIAAVMIGIFVWSVLGSS